MTARAASRAPVFGHVPGFPPGSWFESRRDLAASGVHRPTQAGISGRADGGAESVVLNGGYVDNDDRGATVLYTGSGGNDPKTKRQTADQTLSRFNLALVTSLRLGLPIRVIRGAHQDVRGPQTGYRYDGLYRVADYWPDSGTDGYRIWRFRLEALADEGTPTAERIAEPLDPFRVEQSGERRLSIVSRIIRDSAVTREVKRIHRYRCQVCGDRIETPSGPYAEAAHVRPLGRPHDGPDVLANVLCLCPSDHVAFDLYAFSVDPEGWLVGRQGRLRVQPKHVLDPAHVAYHLAHYRAAQRPTD